MMSNPDDLNAGIRAVADQSSGMLNLVVIRAHELPGLARQAGAGDRFASLVFRAASDLQRGVANIERRHAIQCGSCLNAVLPGSDDHATVVAVPSSVEAADVLSFAMCRTCGPNHAAILSKSVDVLRGIWPDARSVHVHPEGGRA